MENQEHTPANKLSIWINYLQGQNFRKTIHIIFYLIIPILLVITLLFSNNYKLLAQFGEWAWQILLLVLFIKPLVKIIARKELMWLLTYRRELGILCFYFAFAHLVGNILTLKSYDIQNYLPPNNFFFVGALAGIILILLYLSSNNYSMAKLKKNWKRLQSLSYLLLPLISIHQILLEPELGDTLGLVALNIAFIILKILEYKKITLKFKKYDQESQSS